MVPAFKARGCEGFGNDLTALTEAVTARAAQEEVAAIYEGLTDEHLPLRTVRQHG